MADQDAADRIAALERENALLRREVAETAAIAAEEDELLDDIARILARLQRALRRGEITISRHHVHLPKRGRPYGSYEGTPEMRRKAVEEYRRLVGRGVPKTYAAQLAGRTPTTLRKWAEELGIDWN